MARAVESAPSLERAAEALRPDIELQGALRWVRRRAKSVRALLRTLVTLFAWECVPSVASVGAQLGRVPVLVAVREVARDELAVLAPYVGFGPRARGRHARDGPHQH